MLIKFKILAVAVPCFLLLSNMTHAQQTLSVDDLVGMLQNRASASGETQTLTADELARMQRNRIIVERAGSASNITVRDRRSLAKIVRQNPAPSIDMEIKFKYDSDVITPRAMPVLIRLGRALSDRRLSGGTFMIAGHTDAKGSADYNQRLSQRRARSVKRFLADNFGISPRRLIAVGYGEEELKNPYDPTAGENRRVQIVNLAGAVAGR